VRPRMQGALLVLLGVGRGAAAHAEATAVALDGDIRIRRADAADARRLGQALPSAGGIVARTALRGETIAFQVAVIAEDVPIAATTLALSDLVGPGGARLRAAVFREHYLRVDKRSRNDRRPAESLGWHPGAREADVEVVGDVPDALLPIAIDARPVAPPPDVPARATGTFWIDVDVPDGAPPGRYDGNATLTADGATLTRFALAIDVRPTPLPYRAASVFVFYEADRLTARLGSGGPAAERQLWQLLHAHHVDALAPLSDSDDVVRLARAYNGTLFSDAAGYLGPGAGRSPAVVAMGAYGALGAPSPAALARVDRMVRHLPAGPEVFLYANDEQCASTRAGDWQRALAAHPPGRPVAVAQTCDDPPARQAVDIAMLSAAKFARATTTDARAAGRRAFIYNGILPRTGTLLLDADPSGLVANGWIAAAMAIERWFYWESIFWDDDNHGGHGAIDPFTTAETFHNADGDAALGDGLLLYPGRQVGRFAASSLGVDAVFPSLRLKSIRRGIEDAGLLALAAREQPEETARLVRHALPAALDEADPERRAIWQATPLSFAEARQALRALVTSPAAMNDAEVRSAFEDLARRRRAAVRLAPIPPGRLAKAIKIGLPPLVGLLAFVILARDKLARDRRRRRQQP